MTLGDFWTVHHTILSLLIGIISTLIFFRILKIKARWKILAIIITQFLLTGIMGVLKYMALVFIIGAILYGTFISTFWIGLIAIFWLLLSHGVHLNLWKAFIIGAIWGPISMLLDIVKFYVIVFIVSGLGIALDKLPSKFQRLG